MGGRYARELPSLTAEAPGMWRTYGTARLSCPGSGCSLVRGSTAGLPERLRRRECLADEFDKPLLERGSRLVPAQRVVDVGYDRNDISLDVEDTAGNAGVVHNEHGEPECGSEPGFQWVPRRGLGSSVNGALPRGARPPASTRDLNLAKAENDHAPAIWHDAFEVAEDTCRWVVAPRDGHDVGAHRFQRVFDEPPHRLLRRGER